MTLDQLIEELERYRREHASRGGVPLKVQLLAYSEGALAYPSENLPVASVRVRLAPGSAGSFIELQFRRTDPKR